MKKKKLANYHRGRAAHWQIMYLLHATSGKPGRAKNAQRLYNFHLRECVRHLEGSSTQLLLIP